MQEAGGGPAIPLGHAADAQRIRKRAELDRLLEAGPASCAIRPPARHLQVLTLNIDAIPVGGLAALELALHQLRVDVAVIIGTRWPGCMFGEGEYYVRATSGAPSTYRGYAAGILVLVTCRLLDASTAPDSLLKVEKGLRGS